jgi:hypothetical protein
MNIKEDTLEEIRKNEDIIRELSRRSDITCEQVKDILIEYGEYGLVALLRYSANYDDAAEQLKDKYLEE